MPKQIAYSTPTPPQYEDYLNLIRQEAWKRALRNPWVDYEELMAQGRLAFVEAINSWNIEKGAFSTHLWWAIQARMKRVQGCTNYVTMDDDQALQLPDTDPSPENVTAFKAALSGLSQEALQVVWLILEMPWEVVDWTAETIRPWKRNIKRYLMALGWSRPLVRATFTEIRVMLLRLDGKSTPWYHSTCRRWINPD